ncbi:hypothetical protein CDV36_009822 [Fusarium kuroshium]|uniref:Uncharacterized protein n=1 Tax=Fusarium kuroshium TaxID=2010991 RepID=A0A3M2RZ13_9HYPO|nr:hypothetical protein CDV36_009822 [Fusarium kuroshium]
MCWIPCIKFDGCGHIEPRPESQILAVDREWLHKENEQLYRRCPEAARTGVICEKGDCGKCTNEKKDGSKEKK